MLRGPGTNWDSRHGGHGGHGRNSCAELGGGRDRWKFLRTLSLFDFDLRDENARRHGGDRYPARFRTATAVEDGGIVPCCHDLREAGEGRADNIHAAHQLVGPAVRIDAVHHHRQHFEGLWPAARRRREATGNVVEKIPVRLVLLLAFQDEHFAQLRERHGFGRLDDQVGLARHRLAARLAAAMPVRIGEILHRRARQEKGPEDAVFDE